MEQSLSFYGNPNIKPSSLQKYDVSICIVAYNAERFIADAVESVLSQETNCIYEIVVGDDASTDHTAKILTRYQKMAPERFSLVLNRDNAGLSKNVFNLLCAAKGKYIMILYGDDYWIHPCKIQIQYDFLERHEQYIGVSSPLACQYDGEGKTFRVLPPKFLFNTKIDLDKFLSGYDYPMAGMTFRAEAFRNNKEHFHIMVKACRFIDDLSFCILLLMKGDVYVTDTATGAYRCFRKGTNATNFNTVNGYYKRNKRTVELLNELYDLTERKMNMEMRYGLVLASSVNALFHREISCQQYSDIKNAVSDSFKKHYFRMLCAGLMRKAELAIKNR